MATNGTGKRKPQNVSKEDFINGSSVPVKFESG